MMTVEVSELPVTRQWRVIMADKTIRTVLCLLVLCLVPFPVTSVHAFNVGHRAVGIGPSAARLNPQNEAKAVFLLSPVRVPKGAIDNFSVRRLYLDRVNRLGFIVWRDSIIEYVATPDFQRPQLDISQPAGESNIVVSQISGSLPVIRNFYSEVFSAAAIFNVPPARQVRAFHINADAPYSVGGSPQAESGGKQKESENNEKRIRDLKMKPANSWPIFALAIILSILVTHLGSGLINQGAEWIGSAVMGVGAGCALVGFLVLVLSVPG
jgi:hypothetical protein